MTNIKILIIFSKELDAIKEDISKYYFNTYNLRFIYLDDVNLESEILSSDIQIVIIGKELKCFTQELYEKIKKDYLTIYFNTAKYNINKISTTEFKAIKQLNTFKESILNYKSFDKSTLFEQLTKDLDAKIEYIKVKKEAELRPELNSTYLEAIKIKKYFSIIDMEIDDLKDKKEIYFVGGNGDGKTVLLQAILLALKGDEYSVLAEQYISKIKPEMNLSTRDKMFPMEYKTYKNVENVFAYGINRNKIDDKESVEGRGYSALFDTPSIYKTTLLREPITLLKQKSKIIDTFVLKVQDLMDNKLTIDRDNHEVKFQEFKGKDIEFEMLSEGYKSTLIWLCDLVSRLMENQPDIKLLGEYQAIVLVDEVDLYLHPKWKYEFMYKLRKIFPKIQFIMTTHSMVTILGASEDAVFYKVYKEDGETRLTHPMDNIKNLMANNLSTSPLFNLSTARARNSDENIDTSEDYLYTKIHQSISEKIKNKKTIIEDDIMRMINEELALFDKDNS